MTDEIIKAKKAQSESMWMIVAIIVLILALLIIFVLTGKISNIGNQIIRSFG